MSSVQQTLELVRQARSAPSESVARAAGYLQSATATSGLTAYDLEAPAKTLYPNLTPLRNEIPRVVGGHGIQAAWRAITGINTTNVRAGVSQGNRGAALTHSTADYVATFKGFGLEDFVSFEADYAAKGFDDVKARAVEGLLRSAMISEEHVILGGNCSLTMAKPVVTVTQNTDSASSVSNGTLSVICVALGYDAYWALAGYNNGGTGSAVDLSTANPNTIATFTKTNTDASSDSYNGGTSIKSDAATCTIDGSHKSASASVAAVTGACGYAWYWGTGGSEYLGAITTLNSLQITADASTTTAVGSNLAADHSAVSLEFDGLLTIALTSGSGAYVSKHATGTPGTGTKLSTNSAGGITQIDTMCADRWDKYRLSINEIWVNGQDLLNMTKLVVANGGAPLVRTMSDTNSPAAKVTGGFLLKALVNPITGEEITVRVHPNMPQGTMLGRCNMLPYKLSGVADVARMLLRQDYYQLEWPLKSRKWEYGVYFDGVLQHYFPPALAVITNIPNAI
jgi:hypothetical protein